MKNVETQMGQLIQSLRENPQKSFPSDTEKNLKQCMSMTLRTGKELDEPKKIKDDEKQVDKKNMGFEEKIEAENDKEGVEFNNKGNKQIFDEVVPRRMTFPDNPSLYTSSLPFPQRVQKTKLDKQFAKF